MTGMDRLRKSSMSPEDRRVLLQALRVPIKTAPDEPSCHVGDDEWKRRQARGIKRAMERGRFGRPKTWTVRVKGGCWVYTDFAENAIRLRREGMTYRAIAETLGMKHHNMVWRIVRFDGEVNA